MEQMGQWMVEGVAVSTGTALPEPMIADNSPVSVVAAVTLAEPLLVLPSEDSVLDEDEEGVGEPRYCGMS